MEEKWYCLIAMAPGQGSLSAYMARIVDVIDKSGVPCNSRRWAPFLKANGTM
jgi:hypothetical protein